MTYKKKLSLVAVFTLISFVCFSQKSSVSGVVVDTVTNDNMKNASVSLIRQSDSLLFSFTRSDAGGNFNLRGIDSGRYFLLVTFPTFADYTDNVQVGPGQQLDLGKIMMTLTANLLDEVVVRQQISGVRMKGDTTEFVADSFRVRPGANVEEMLKKLPGIQVDKDGKITAMGEQVQKVLVDGDEFFGDDPTVATKNLQAEDIDKVQVFDKKSDQAEFTGIDDGSKTKTINLKMKADRNKGYFGKLDLAAGLDDKWANSAMFNRFRGAKKISAYGIMSSTGKTGLSWEDRDRYGSSENYEMMDGGIFISYGDDFSSPSYYGEGLPKSWSAGLNYANKINEDKHNINGSYRFNKLNTEIGGNTLAQVVTGQNIFNTNEQSSSFNSRTRHSISGVYEWKVDSSTNIKFRVNGNTGNNFSRSNTISQTMNANQISNNSNRNNSSSGSSDNLNSSLAIQRKFKKQGRTISLYFTQQYAASNTLGYLYAKIDTLSGGGQLNGYVTDQKMNYDNSNFSWSSKIVYTEPLAKKWFLELNYLISGSKSEADRLTYNKDGNGKYEELSDSFSNKYKYDYFTQTGGTSLKYNGTKLTLSAGTDVSQTDFDQTDLFSNAITKRNYTNFFPKAQVVYKLPGNGRVYLNYNGSTRQPTIQQIQPVLDNSNPLSITVGNPLLKQSFNHRINFNVNSYKVLKQRGFYSYGGIFFTQNDIVNSSTINDTSAKTIYQYININGNYNFWTGGGYWLKLKKLDANLNFGFYLNGYHSNGMVNNQKSLTENYAPQINMSFNKEKEKKYNVGFSASYEYNFSTSTVQLQKVHNNYYTINTELDFTIQLPAKFEINNSIAGTFRQTTPLFTQNNRMVIWDGYIGRKFLKDDKAIIKITAHDILNQNLGYTRDVSANRITERNYQTIGRYFLLNFVWNFSKTPASATGLSVQ